MKKKLALMMLALNFQAQLTDAQPISPLIMGQNYHYSTWNNVQNFPANIGIFGSSYTNTFSGWPKVTASGAKLVRVGGRSYNHDNASFNPFNAKPTASAEIYYVKIVDDIRSNGCEPVITIPFECPLSATNTSHSSYISKLNDAKIKGREIVRLLNGVHRRAVKYFVIANEPDLDYGWNALSSAQIAANIAEYTREISTAIKDVDASIKVIGPELAYYYPDVYLDLFGFTSSTNRIDGLIQSGSGKGRPYIDYLSYHLYLYDFSDDPGDQNSNYITNSLTTSTLTPPITWANTAARDFVYTELEKYLRVRYDGQCCGKRARGSMRQVRDICDLVSQSRGIPLGWMITEMNNNTANEPGISTSNTNGLDARSLLGAQNIARTYALAMEYKCTSVMMWSVKEGTATAHSENRGYMDGPTGDRQPSYWHYKAMARYFQGTYLKDEVLNHLIMGTGTDFQNEPDMDWLHYNSINASAYNVNTTFGMKAFGAKSDVINIMVLNHTSTAKSFTIHLGGTYTTSTHGSNIFRFNAGVTTSSLITHQFTNATLNNGDSKIDANSTTILTFNCSGQLLRRQVYDLTRAQSESNDFLDVYYPPSPLSWPGQVSTSTPPNPAPCLSPSITSSFQVYAPSNSSFTWYKLPNKTTPLPFNGDIATGLTPGIYQIDVSIPACGTNYTTSIVRVVHHQSPIVDAGPDQNFCSSNNSLTSVQLGNANLPTQNVGYNWDPPQTNGTTYNASSATYSSTTTNFVLTATENSCTLSDQAVVFGGNTPDLMIRDSYNDVGSETNIETYFLDNDAWSYSPDLWPSNVGSTTYSPAMSGTLHRFNVKITNRSCANVDADEATLKIHSSVAGTGGSWKTTWDSYPCYSVTSNCPNNGLLCGGEFYDQQIHQPIPSMSSVIESFTFMPEALGTPSLTGVGQYTCTGSPQSSTHSVNYCHLAWVDLVGDQLDLLNHPNWWVPGLVKDHNNLAWVNMTILTGAGDGTMTVPQGGILINHYSPASMVDLEFITYNVTVISGFTDTPIHEGAGGIVIDPSNFNPFDWTEIEIKLSRGLIEMWEQGGSQGEGVIKINDTIVQLISRKAVMTNIWMQQNQHFPMEVILTPIRIPDTLEGRYFGLHLKQSDVNGPQTGGYSYLIDKRGWVCNECDNGDSELMSGQMMSSRTISNDSLYVSDTLIIGNGITMALEKVKVFFGERALIKVLQGGKLIVNNSQMVNACTSKKWAGIEVTGTSAAVNCLTITNSFFKNTDTPVRLKKAEGILIANSTFVGNNIGTAIHMEKGKDFNFHDNTFTRFEKGIETTKSKSNDNYSVIEKNIFSEMKTAVQFINDNHADLQLNCNRFEYQDYAIQSDSTTLSNIGSSTVGAGNVFVSKSSLANNKLKHLNGNSPTYYYSPADSITEGMSVNLLASQGSFSCYPLPDTSSLSRSSTSTGLAKENDEKKLTLSAIPNPNNGRAAIHYGLGVGNSGVITVHDAQGRLIDRRNVYSSEDKIEINYRGYASGIYFISLITEDQKMLHRKMVITE